MNRPYNYKWWLLALVIACLPVVSNASGELRDFDGNVHSLDEFTGKGKWLVVMIWESNCPICNREAHQYVDFHEFHQDNDATVLGISIDGKARKPQALDFLKRHEVNFPSLIAEPMDVALLYTNLTGEFFRGTPTFLIFGPQGDLLARQAGAVPTELIEAFMEREAAAAVPEPPAVQ